MKLLNITLILYGVLMLLDLIWLGIVAKKFYTAQIGGLMRQQPNVLAGVLVYFLLAVGITVFVISPYIVNPSNSNPVLLGALFGLIVYSVYDLTNLAILYKWPLELSVLDILWGTALCSISTFIITRFFI